MTAIHTDPDARQPEMVPRFLVIAMFSVMLFSLGLVGYARLTGMPRTGVLVEAPIVAESTVHLVGSRNGEVTVRDIAGQTLAHSADDKMGFLGVVWRVMARHRMVNGQADSAPVRVVRRENGNIAVIDTATDWSLELIGYGSDNVAAFARLVD